MSQSRATLTIKITFPENCSNEISSPALFLARSSVNDIVLPRALSVSLMCTALYSCRAADPASVAAAKPATRYDPPRPCCASSSLSRGEV